MPLVIGGIDFDRLPHRLQHHNIRDRFFKRYDVFRDGAVCLSLLVQGIPSILRVENLPHCEEALMVAYEAIRVSSARRKGQKAHDDGELVLYRNELRVFLRCFVRYYDLIRIALGDDEEPWGARKDIIGGIALNFAQFDRILAALRAWLAPRSTQLGSALRIAEVSVDSSHDLWQRLIAEGAEACEEEQDGSTAGDALPLTALLRWAVVSAVSVGVVSEEGVVTQIEGRMVLKRQQGPVKPDGAAYCESMRTITDDSDEESLAGESSLSVWALAAAGFGDLLRSRLVEMSGKYTAEDIASSLDTPGFVVVPTHLATRLAQHSPVFFKHYGDADAVTDSSPQPSTEKEKKGGATGQDTYRPGWGQSQATLRSPAASASKKSDMYRNKPAFATADQRPIKWEFGELGASASGSPSSSAARKPAFVILSPPESLMRSIRRRAGSRVATGQPQVCLGVVRSCDDQFQDTFSVDPSRSEMGTPLQFAVAGRCEDAVRVLLEFGASPALVTGTCRVSAVAMAVAGAVLPPQNAEADGRSSTESSEDEVDPILDCFDPEDYEALVQSRQQRQLQDAEFAKEVHTNPGTGVGYHNPLSERLNKLFTAPVDEPSRADSDDDDASDPIPPEEQNGDVELPVVFRQGLNIYCFNVNVGRLYDPLLTAARLSRQLEDIVGMRLNIRCDLPSYVAVLPSRQASNENAAKMLNAATMETDDNSATLLNVDAEALKRAEHHLRVKRLTRPACTMTLDNDHHVHRFLAVRYILIREARIALSRCYSGDGDSSCDDDTTVALPEPITITVTPMFTKSRSNKPHNNYMPAPIKGVSAFGAVSPVKVGRPSPFSARDSPQKKGGHERLFQAALEKQQAAAAATRNEEALEKRRHGAASGAKDDPEHLEYLHLLHHLGDHRQKRIAELAAALSNDDVEHGMVLPPIKLPESPPARRSSPRRKPSDLGFARSFHATVWDGTQPLHVGADIVIRRAATGEATLQDNVLQQETELRRVRTFKEILESAARAIGMSPVPKVIYSVDGTAIQNLNDISCAASRRPRIRNSGGPFFDFVMIPQGKSFNPQYLPCRLTGASERTAPANRFSTQQTPSKSHRSSAAPAAPSPKPTPKKVPAKVPASSSHSSVGPGSADQTPLRTPARTPGRTPARTPARTPRRLSASLAAEEPAIANPEDHDDATEERNEATLPQTSTVAALFPSSEADQPVSDPPEILAEPEEVANNVASPETVAAPVLSKTIRIMDARFCEDVENCRTHRETVTVDVGVASTLLFAVAEAARRLHIVPPPTVLYSADGRRVKTLEELIIGDTYYLPACGEVFRGAEAMQQRSASSLHLQLSASLQLSGEATSADPEAPGPADGSMEEEAAIEVAETIALESSREHAQEEQESSS